MRRGYASDKQTCRNLSPVEAIERIAEARQKVTSGEARRIREAAEVSQAEAAASLGVSRSAVCLWELGNRLPRGDVALRYHALLETLSRFGERRP